MRHAIFWVRYKNLYTTFAACKSDPVSLDTQVFHNEGLGRSDMEPPSRRSSQEPTSEFALPTVRERWSAPRKTEVVFRLLRGEPLDRVSRESQVHAHELEHWQRTFMEGGMQGLKRQGNQEARDRPRPADSVRWSLAICGDRVDSGGEIAGDRDLAELRRRTPLQRCCGAVHADPAGTVSVPAAV